MPEQMSLEDAVNKTKFLLTYDNHVSSPLSSQILDVLEAEVKEHNRMKTKIAKLLSQLSLQSDLYKRTNDESNSLYLDNLHLNRLLDKIQEDYDIPELNNYEDTCELNYDNRDDELFLPEN